MTLAMTGECEGVFSQANGISLCLGILKILNNHLMGLMISVYFHLRMIVHATKIYNN